jgi:hypothetical protein
MTSFCVQNEQKTVAQKREMIKHDIKTKTLKNFKILVDYNAQLYRTEFLF